LLCQEFQQFFRQFQKNTDQISGQPSLIPIFFMDNLSQKFDLYFFELPEELLKLLAQQNVDAEFVEVQHSLLRGLTAG